MILLHRRCLAECQRGLHAGRSSDIVSNGHRRVRVDVEDLHIPKLQVMVCFIANRNAIAGGEVAHGTACRCEEICGTANRAAAAAGDGDLVAAVTAASCEGKAVTG